MDTDQNSDRSKMATTKTTNPKRQQTKNGDNQNSCGQNSDKA